MADGMAILGTDTIRGTDVTCTMEVDDKRYNLLHPISCEASGEISQEDVVRIGDRNVDHKNGTINNSGSMEAYYGDPTVRHIFLDYIATGKWPDITLIIRNWDKDSRSGAQTVVLSGVKFTSINWVKFDAATTMLQETFEFTFRDARLSEEFGYLPGVTNA